MHGLHSIVLWCGQHDVRGFCGNNPAPMALTGVSSEQLHTHDAGWCLKRTTTHQRYWRVSEANNPTPMMLAGVPSKQRHSDCTFVAKFFHPGQIGTLLTEKIVLQGKDNIFF